MTSSKMTFNCMTLCSKHRNRVTSLVDFSPIGLLLKARYNINKYFVAQRNGKILLKQIYYIDSFKTWFVIGIVRFKSSLMQIFWILKMRLDVDILAFLIWQLLWLLFVKLGKFFLNHLVTLHKNNYHNDTLHKYSKYSSVFCKGFCFGQAPAFP